MKHILGVEPLLFDTVPHSLLVYNDAPEHFRLYAFSCSASEHSNVLRMYIL